jgi:hypothetical protein
MNSAIAHQEIKCVLRVKFLHANIAEVLAGAQAWSINRCSIEYPILGILPILVMTFCKGQERSEMSVEEG